jgi:cytosine/adenosine deaminase-related metal-dependent hydrolase
MAAARTVMSGVTTAVDHVYPLHRPGLLAAVLAGHADVGLRAYLGYGLMTEGPPELVGPLDDQVAAAIAAADTELPAQRLYLAPVSLRQTSLDGYRAAVAAADRTGLRLYTHIAESTDEVEQCVARHGMRPVELLHNIGFLRPGTVLVHCVQLTDHEIELIAANSVAVAYCPSNHLRLAKGFAPVVAMRAAGVRVCLGVDGMDDMFTEMRQAVYAQGSAVGRPGALPSLDALAMATGEGAAAIGAQAAGDSPGRLRAGDRADLVTVRTDFPSWQPLADPVQACVHRGHGRDVADVLVDGEFVVRDGRLHRADPAAIAERAWAATRDLAHRSGREVGADWRWRPGATTYHNDPAHADRVGATPTAIPSH